MKRIAVAGTRTRRIAPRNRESTGRTRRDRTSRKGRPRPALRISRSRARDHHPMRSGWNVASAMRSTMTSTNVAPIAAHLPLPPKTMGMGPMKTTPAVLCSASPLSPVDLKLKRSRSAPSPVIASPRQRRGMEAVTLGPSILGRILGLKSF
jgi:hypothetical protein